jgi:hypothetical protein
VNTRLQASLLVPEHRGPASPLSLTAREPSLPCQRARMPDSPLRGGKLQPAILQVAPEAMFPQGTQKPIASHCTSLQESHVSLSKSWNLSSSTEWQYSSLLVLGGLLPTVHRNPALPVGSAQLQDSPCGPIKEQELQSPC